ncbi:hypothetical protein GCM10025868_37720 [Angustibacter aerolatus]|uniref:Uncharacterized protein n=1 Tax=Angustibacter aerolatus TaxID=1162965 RepID=A0ABQ6JL65_9ACTN|nr:hypothetical protein [Angustibacter aerolatus]GMA88522.1 hypothetical protein GCM10025868_37720 [Angustibacter aerolatus]
MTEAGDRAAGPQVRRDHVARTTLDRLPQRLRRQGARAAVQRTLHGRERGEHHRVHVGPGRCRGACRDRRHREVVVDQQHQRRVEAGEQAGVDAGVGQTRPQPPTERRVLRDARPAPQRQRLDHRRDQRARGAHDGGRLDVVAQGVGGRCCRDGDPQRVGRRHVAERGDGGSRSRQRLGLGLEVAARPPGPQPAGQRFEPRHARQAR